MSPLPPGSGNIPEEGPERMQAPALGRSPERLFSGLDTPLRHKLRASVFTCSGHAERGSNCFVMPRGKAHEAPPLINVYESKRNKSSK